MTIHCKYHPLDIATWHCEGCHIAVCDNCSAADSSSERPERRCVLCRKSLAPMGAAHALKPFWTVLTEQYSYALSPPGLTVLVAGLILALLAPFSYAGIAFGLAFVFLLVLYGVSLMEHTAAGEMDPIGFEDNMQRDLGLDSLLKAVVLLLLLSAGIVWGWLHYKMPTLLGIMLLVAWLPGFFMQLIRYGKFDGALSPAGLMSLISGVQVPYLMLVAALLVPLLALMFVQGLFADILPVPIMVALRVITCAWWLISCMRLSAYFLYQYQTEVGLTERAERARRSSKARVLDPIQLQIEILIKEGRFKQAAEMFEQDLGRKASNPLLNARYHKLLQFTRNTEAMQKHAPMYFSLLLNSSQDQQALALLREYLALMPGFKPRESAVRLQLARTADAVKDYKVAIYLLNGMHKDAPHFVELPDAYMLAAEILFRRLKMPAKALPLMDFLVSRFGTSHPQSRQMHALYKEIQAAAVS